MKIKQTKALENALARGVLAQQLKGGDPADRALLALLADNDSHAAYILSKFLKDWELSRIIDNIESGLEEEAKIKSVTSEDGKSSINDLNAALEAICEEFPVGKGQEAKVNTGHLLIYILRHREFVSTRTLAMYNITDEAVTEYLVDFPFDEDYYAEMNALRNIHILSITPKQEQNIQDGSEEEDYDAGEDNTGDGHSADAGKSAVSGIEKYGVNLTKAAIAGDIDPVIGRNKEIERLIQILGRRKKNNPILIGEAGVGKSAIAEGLALRLASGDIPPALKGKTLFSLDIASMVAGTKYRGQFEERLKAFMKELARNKDIILFIDEIHTIVGAGATQGSLDTANILKPALARGEVQCIGATTLDEYRENIEKDSALERRFQKILVEPTSKNDTLKILTNIKEHYERHHSVRYSDEAVAACVELTERYITDRHFPDKAIDVLDEAGSKAHMFNLREPEVLKELEEALRAATDEKRRAAASFKYDEATKARMREVALSDKVKELRSDWLREVRLNPTVITPENIQEVVSMMTGIPVQSVSQDEKSRLKDMSAHLGSLIIGQQDAVDKVTKSIQRSRAGLKDPNKPIGVFMFVGPTGVGKTLLAKELSKWMFDRPDALVRVDMSEYSEKHNVSRMIGSPPGYVGHGEGGQLTEIVRRQPYSVILFDEIEKAHPDVFNIMLQIFDEGQLTDGLGRKVDFRNTVIIMTSNVGSRRISARPPVIGYGVEEVECIEETNIECGYREALEDLFAPEFLNRIDDIVVFNRLGFGEVRKIVDLELRLLFLRSEAMGYKLSATGAARDELTELGYDPRYGVRSLKRVIMEHVEEPLAQMIVCEEVEAGDETVIDFTSSKGIVLKKRRSKKQKCRTSA